MNNYNGNELFYKYYERWINIYKKGAIKNSTMQKYHLSLKWLKKLAPKLKLKEVMFLFHFSMQDTELYFFSYPLFFHQTNLQPLM